MKVRATAQLGEVAGRLESNRAAQAAKSLIRDAILDIEVQDTTTRGVAAKAKRRKLDLGAQTEKPAKVKRDSMKRGRGRLSLLGSSRESSRERNETSSAAESESSEPGAAPPADPEEAARLAEAAAAKEARKAERDALQSCLAAERSEMEATRSRAADLPSGIEQFRNAFECIFRARFAAPPRPRPGYSDDGSRRDASVPS